MRVAGLGWVLLLVTAPPISCNTRACSRWRDKSCEVCNGHQGYVSDGAGGCVQMASSYCTLFSGLGNCLLCSRDMKSVGPLCRNLKTIPNCMGYNKDGSCNTCDRGTYLNSSKSCSRYLKEIPNCAYYSSYNACGRCEQSFVLKNGACVKAFPYCMVQSSLSCKTCSSGTFSPSLPVSSSEVFYRNFWQISLQMIRKTLPTTPIDSAVCYENLDTNCKVAKDISVCAICKPDFYVHGTGVCFQVSVPVNSCSEYASDSVCRTCKDGYLLSNNTCIDNPKAQSQPNCMYYNIGALCTRCVPGFYIDSNNQCISSNAVANCEVPGPNADCIYCKKDFYRSSLTSCVRIYTNGVDNCVAYAGSSCSACDSTTYLTTTSPPACLSVNLPLIPSCSRYGSATVCTECSTGYYLSGNSCVPFSPKNCRYYNAMGVCTDCMPDNLLTSNRDCEDAGSQKVANCEIMLSPGRCSSCNFNYRLSLDTTACVSVARDMNCEVFSDDVLCQFCVTNFYLDPSTNSCIPLGLTEIINGCYRYSSKTSCVLCSAGFFLSQNGTCVQETFRIQGCLAKGLSDTNCVLCSNRVSPVPSTVPGAAGTCGGNFPTTANCLFSSSPTTCIQCSSGFYFTSNSCRVLLAPNLSCYSYGIVNNATACVRCKAGTFLSNRACSTITSPPANCDWHASATTCNKCSTGFIPNAAGSACVPRVPLVPILNCVSMSSPTLCGVCDSGFYPSTGSTSCIALTQPQIISNCQRYNPLVACVECSIAGKLDNNLCNPIVVRLPFCKYHLTASQCDMCEKDYILNSSGTCDPVGNNFVPNCEEYLPNLGCVACTPGFELSTGVCVLNIAKKNCIEYFSLQTCKTCDSTSYLDGDSCTPLPLQGASNCQVFDRPNLCRSCPDNFVLTKDKSACLPNCEIAGDKTSCVRCIPQFFPDAGVCKLVSSNMFISNCRYYSKDQLCSQCSTSYSLIGGKCVFIKNAANCDEIDMSNICLLCMPGYTKNATGACVSILGMITSQKGITDHNPIAPIPRNDQVLPGCLVPDIDETGKIGCGVCDQDYYQETYLGPCKFFFDP